MPEDSVLMPPPLIQNRHPDERRMRLEGQRAAAALGPLELAAFNALSDAGRLCEDALLTAVRRVLPQTEHGVLLAALAHLNQHHLAFTQVGDVGPGVWCWGAPAGPSIPTIEAEPGTPVPPAPRATIEDINRRLTLQLPFSTAIAVGSTMHVVGGYDRDGVVPLELPTDVADDLAAGRFWLVVTDGERAVRLHRRSSGAWESDEFVHSMVVERFEIVSPCNPKYLYGAA